MEPCGKPCPQPQPPPGIEIKDSPRWKHWTPILCDQPKGHDGLHGGPYLFWH